PNGSPITGQPDNFAGSGVYVSRNAGATWTLLTGPALPPSPVNIAATNNNSQGYTGLVFGDTQGYVPPDTSGAVGPSAYVESANQTLALFPDKNTGAGRLIDNFDDFLYTVGGLTPTSGGSFLSDPIVTYDEHIQRFIVGDQDVDFSGTNLSNFDIAVSKTSNPATLTAADWNFYQISTTQPGFDADYPGNFGYNHDAFVFTLNMFGPSTIDHVLVTSVNAADLQNGVPRASLRTFQNNYNGDGLRPTVMHDSVAGDPMWLLSSIYGGGS